MASMMIVRLIIMITVVLLVLLLTIRVLVLYEEFARLAEFRLAQNTSSFKQVQLP